MSTNVFRIVLATGAAYKDASILSSEEMEAVGLPLFFDQEEQVGFIGDGHSIVMHKSGLDAIQLNQDHPHPSTLGENVVQFEKVVLSGGKVYGPGYMSRSDGDSLAAAGVPDLKFFDKPVVIVTNEGTFLTDASKIHSAILSQNPGGIQALRGHTAATIGVRSARNVPNAHQAVLARMQEGVQEAEIARREQGEAILAGHPTDPSAAQASHYYGSGRTIRNVTTQGDIDPLAAEAGEQRGDADADVIHQLDEREQSRRDALASGETSSRTIPVAQGEMAKRGVAVHNPAGPATQPTPTTYPENSGNARPGDAHLVSKSQGGAVSPMGVSENEGQATSVDQMERDRRRAAAGGEEMRSPQGVVAGPTPAVHGRPPEGVHSAAEDHNEQRDHAAPINQAAAAHHDDASEQEEDDDVDNEPQRQQSDKPKRKRSK